MDFNGVVHLLLLFLIYLYVLFDLFRLPEPMVPHFSYFAKLLPDAIAIAIVAFAISVSMASLMAKRNNYEVNSNQVS